MRIAIVTHPRSGGFSFLGWLSAELECESIHEPFREKTIPPNLFTSPNLVVKIFPGEIQALKLPLVETLSKFDFLICHKRMDLEETSISTVRQSETGISHEVYDVDEEWLNKNRNKIDSTRNSILQRHAEIDAVYNAFRTSSIKTTYEGLYLNRQDRERIHRYLRMERPFRFMDMLDPKRRLRGGTIGMEGMDAIRLI